MVRNAVRYAGEDGPIAIAARPQGDRVCVEIRDSGPGVPAEEMEHITEPFFRGEQAKKYPGGSGLGMSIVKHCVEACGGELHYYNQYPNSSLYFGSGQISSSISISRWSMWSRILSR